MELQTQADRAFQEKSYARALDLYRKAPQNEKNQYQIALALFKTEKWDEALATSDAALKTANWKARFYYLRGQIFVKAPKNGWKLGEKTWRQNEYPEVKGDQKPQQVSFYAEDQKAALENLETAKIEAQKERGLAMRARFAAPIYPLSWDEENDLDFDLSAYLPQVQFDEFLESLKTRTDAKFDEQIEPKAPYATGWSLPKKVLTLYAEIRVLDQSADKTDTQKSLLAEGLFVRAYQQRMSAWSTRYDEETKKYVTRAFPFDDLAPAPIWRRLVTEFPQSDLAPRALLFIAEERSADPIAQLAVYDELLRKYPKSKLVSDARAARAQILRKEVSFSVSSQPRPGKSGRIQVQSRNVKQIEFAAYRIQLEKYLTTAAHLKNAETQFTSFTQNFGQVANIIKTLGKPYATWNYTPQKIADYHQTDAKELDAPLKDVGAYVVVARAGGVRFAQIVLNSDLALLKKSDKNGSFVYVANAKTGAAVSGANVVLKEVWSWSPRKVDFSQGKSDDAGFFDKKRVGDNGSQVSAFAYVGNRYALTGQQGSYWNNRERDETRVLGTTDRPVYRPGQKVNFRQIVTARNVGGDWKPLVGRSFFVRASNPKGEKFFETTLITNEFGSVSGEFTIPETAPLGEFSLQLSDDQNISGGTQFRVEEYKRPEFEVTVSAPTEAKRPGEVVAARINAKYYFGAPVPNAKVKYTVRKSTWWASYQFPTPYDWLYSSWGAGDYNTGRRNIGGEGSGEIIKEGEVQTDEKGFAELSFKTQELDDSTKNDWWSRYSNPLYTIEAEVTDASRRTIEAQGQVKVARQPYFAFLNTQRGYFQKGDRIPIELRTQDANEQSVAASGKMVVYKLLPGDKEEKVFEEAVSTDAGGRAFWNWEAKDSGQFRVEYQSKGAWGDEIKAQTEIWVVGDEIGAIRLRGVTILLDKKSYEEGDTLRARIIADKPGAHVLLTQEASGEILRRDVLQIDAQSKEVDIPIEKKHVPNFFLAAALVQDFEVYQAQTEVFVPPTKQLLNLKVSGDKATYKPGETGTFQIEARDYSGKPARAEVSLALVDASLFYIQKDYAPEIRGFYYGERRQNSVNLDSSRSGNPEARFENDEKTINYEGHGFELPDDFGQLQLMPGGFSYGGGRHRSRISGGLIYDNEMPLSSVSGRINALENRAAAAPMMGDIPVIGRLFKSSNADGAATSAAPPVAVRSNFAETAFWSPSVITDGGKATVKVTFPDSLTQWHASALGLTPTVQVGSAQTDVATKKDLLVRLQAPRFFVEKDRVVISANVHNYSDKEQEVIVNLKTDALLKFGIKPIPYRVGDPPYNGPVQSEQPTQSIVLDPGEEQRLNWNMEVAHAGDATLQVTARTNSASDAVKMSFPVLVHGVQRFAGQSGVLVGDGSQKIKLNFPKERKLGASELNVQLNPSLAAQMLDALPYLVDYPYGCVEQTMSRFLPTVLVQKSLRDSGVNLETLRARAKAYDAESKTEARGDRVQNTGYSYPKGQPNSRDLTEMASKSWFFGRSNNPIFDQSEIDKMTREGLNRLYAMQRGDGGWGWWPGSAESDEYMSAYVVYGLYQAENAGVSVRDDVLKRGANYLKAQMKDEDNLQLLTYIAYSLSQNPDLKRVGARRAIEDWEKIASGRLFEQRERLAPLSKAYLALTLSNLGEIAKANVVIRNLENTVQIDAANGTARFKTAPQYWYWWNNDVETVALALRAFDQIEPKNKLVPLMTKWLTLQARGNHYRSTKETAEVVYTLADYVTKNEELNVDYTLKVSLNGKIARTYRVTKDNALFFDNRFIAGDLFLGNGANSLTIEKSGKGKLYWNAYSEYFSLEEPIKASGNELDISRKFFKLTRLSFAEQVIRPEANGLFKSRIAPPFPRPQNPAEPEYNRAEIKDGETVKSGDLIEVELVVNAKNDYEYLVFEDMKAAGFEPVEIRSGQSYGDGLSSNVELRDEKVSFFVDRLPQGRRVLRYRVRAEAPGTFHALPTNGYAMYAPEVRAISDEMRVSVQD
ncbi:hypothetical protein B1R32_105150 [Abditibacterium utsteinense]|uniref:Alpha-2-macroglobulin n=2 Tax=Abditibacterium utsteinense TaxID=1960156 RepID=A0A2S8SUK1_9BACT|nr:hypothetical protein B1R32_105150 [Abditibacterium utsteinense]